MPTDGQPADDAKADSVDDADVVREAAEAAENVIFSRYDQGEIRDIDVTVTFDEGEFEVDVYLDVSEDSDDPDRVVEDAVLAARSVADEKFS
jgi:hypothetical protein